MGIFDPLEPTGAFGSSLSQEKRKVKEEHGREDGRIGKGCLPILGLTLELRSSRRFPALLLRNLMDGDRSRFLIRLVMVDPSTAIMMRSTRGQILAQSWNLSQKRHCLPTPQVLPVCPPTDLRWQRPPYLLPSRVCSSYL